MGATFNTGYLENLILYNGSNNIGIGTSADATYKVTLGGSLLGTSGVFSSSITATGESFITGSDGGGKMLKFTGGTTKFNWMIAAQQNVNNGLEITPSSAAGGSTFSTPAVVVTSGGLVLIGNTTNYYNYLFQTRGQGYFYSTTNDVGILINPNTTIPNIQGVIPSSGNNGNISLQAAGGNVGIGESSPNFKLHISAGSTSFITQPTAGSYAAYIQQNTSGSTGGLYIQDGSSNSGNSLFIADNGGNARFVVNGDGSVGIGTSSISTTSTPHLFIKDNNISMFGGGSRDSYVGTNFYYNSAWYYRGTGGASMTQYDDDVIIFKNAASGSANGALTWSERMRITNVGTVIVKGQNDDIVQVGDSISGHNAYLQLKAGSTGNAYVNSTGSGSLILGANGAASNHLQITSGGNVLIGSTGIYGGGTTNESELLVVGNPPTADTDRGLISFMDNRAYNTATLGAKVMMGGAYNTAGAITFFAGLAGLKENTTDGNYAGALAFYTRANGAASTERMRITSGGNLQLPNPYSVTLNSTATTTLISDFPRGCSVLINVVIQWTSNGAAQRTYLIHAGATSTGWGTPNSGLTVLSSLDWSGGYVGAATFSIGGTGASRTLDISVANANTYNVSAYASVIRFG